MEEDEVYQTEFWSDPTYPPNHQFGGLQWEAVKDQIIAEEDKPRPSAFEVDMLEGFI